LARIFRTNDRGHEVLAAEGYEVERSVVYLQPADNSRRLTQRLLEG